MGSSQRPHLQHRLGPGLQIQTQAQSLHNPNPKPNSKLGLALAQAQKPSLRLLHISSSRLEVALRWSSYCRRHQETLPPSATTGAAAHLVGAMHGEPHAGVGENQLATSRRGCCCWGRRSWWERCEWRIWWRSHGWRLPELWAQWWARRGRIGREAW